MFNKKIPEETIDNKNVFSDDAFTIKEKIEQKEGVQASETHAGFQLFIEDFESIKGYVQNTDITDVDYNNGELVLTDIYNRHWKAKDGEDMLAKYDANGKEIEDGHTPEYFDKSKLTIEAMTKLAQNVANIQSQEFNQKNPFLEAETKDLRFSSVHPSIAQTGLSICIRKTPVVERIKEGKALEEAYVSEPVLCLLANFVKAHMNVIICGNPGAGKTELAKFISKYIPDLERVITIEDVLEWHYKALNPTADVIEMKTNKDITYSDAIVASLKQNPDWIMIAETRANEVKYLMQGFTTGVNGITTLHTDDVRKVPERMVNMIDDSIVEKRFKNNVYEFIDVAIMVSMKPDGKGGQRRYIDQIGFFSNDEGENKCYLLLDDGEFYRTVIPSKIKKKFKNAQITNPFENELVKENLIEQGYKETKKDKMDKEKAAAIWGDKLNLKATDVVKANDTEPNKNNSDENNNENIKMAALEPELIQDENSIEEKIMAYKSQK